MHTYWFPYCYFLQPPFFVTKVLSIQFSNRNIGFLCCLSCSFVVPFPYQCLSGEPVTNQIPRPDTTTTATSPTSPTITSATATPTAANCTITTSYSDERDVDTVTEGDARPAGVTYTLTPIAFYRLCWLAMQMPRRDAEQLYEHFRSTALTLPVFRELLAKHNDRCKGVVYFDSARRLDLGDASGQPAVSTGETANGKQNGGSLTVKEVRTKSKKTVAKRVDSNGSAGEKVTTKIVTPTSGTTPAVTSQSKRQKAD